MGFRKTVLSLAATTAAVLAGGVAMAETAVYEIDSVHSSVIWKVSHLNTSNAYGRFNDIAGKITLDEADPSKNAIDVTIKAESIDSANEKRDQHLKGPDFLNAKQFPEISLKSDSVKKVDDKTYAVEAQMTFRGVTKPISFQFTKTGASQNPKSKKDLVGGEGQFTFKRSDFGMNYMPQALGEEISVIASVEAVKQ